MVLEADKIIEKERIERENKMRKMMGIESVEEEEAKAKKAERKEKREAKKKEKARKKLVVAIKTGQWLHMELGKSAPSFGEFESDDVRERRWRYSNRVSARMTRRRASS